MQVAQRRITGAEIVDAQLHAQRLQTLEQLRGQLGVFHYDAFRDLKFQMTRLYMSFFQNLGDLADKVGLGNLFAGKIHAHEKLTMRRRFPLPL